MLPHKSQFPLGNILARSIVYVWIVDSTRVQHIARMRRAVNVETWKQDNMRISREGPDAPSMLPAERNACAKAVVSGIDLIGWQWMFQTVTIQSLVSLDRRRGLCVTSHIQLLCYTTSFDRGIISMLNFTEIGTVGSQSDCHEWKAHNGPTFAVFCNLAMS